MTIVSQRDSATLLPIIQAHVVPGTIIHSDQWAAYNGVSTLPNVSFHQTVKDEAVYCQPTLQLSGRVLVEGALWFYKEAVFHQHLLEILLHSTLSLSNIYTK